MNALTSPLLTDYYQLMMLESYLEQGMHETAVFELFVRKLPPRRNFMVAAGLEQVLDFLENLKFSPEELDWLRPRFGAALVAYLEQFSFTGDIHAMPEGTPFFPDEPVLRVTAPLPQGQLVESRIMNLLHFETLIATKAVRSVLVAPGKFLVDFGQTGYIDSSGLGVLVSLSKRIRELNGDLRLSNLNDDLKTLFELTKLDTLFQISDTRDRALASF